MSAIRGLHETATRLIGPCEVTAVLAAGVVHVSAGRGEFVVKQHDSRDKHDREVHAYRHWTSSLGSAAPELIAADDATMTIVTSALNGQPRYGEPPLPAYRQAGALLRRFHDAEPPRELLWYRDWLRHRVRHWTVRAAGLLPAADTALIGRHLAALEELPIPPGGGPCHLDFQPRNWLLTPSGDLSVIDFEHARIDLPARDLVRLCFRHWPARPGLRDAFFEGYGRQLSDTEAEMIRHLGALDALTAIARGRQQHDAQLTESGHATLRQLRHRP